MHDDLMTTMKLFNIAGRSGQGKTTLIEALLAQFRVQGWTVNVVKHSHHALTLEPPHKDSARFRVAGAGEVLIASPFHYAILHELRDEAQPSLEALLARLAPADLTLVEGYTGANLPKLEVVRDTREPFYPEDGRILALASDGANMASVRNQANAAARLRNALLPVFALDDAPRIAAFICETVGLTG